MQTVAKLKRLREVERRYKALKEERNPSMRRYYACLANEQLDVQVCRSDQV